MLQLMTSKTTQPSCADTCLASGEPLAGTAIRVDVWLMLEYRRAWQAKATDNNTLSPATQSWLNQTVDSFASKGLTARVQFIRRPQRQQGRQLFVARNGQLEGQVVDTDAELAELDLLATQLPALTDTQYFVCTNAKRDICCARLGRPTYAALHQLVPGRAWQTTHVGGHRYAPNILVLPQAALYGRVTPKDVSGFMRTVEAGELDRRFLRGRTTFSALAQVVEAQLNTAQELLAETAESATFATPDGPQTLAVTQDPEIMVLPSCGKPEKPFRVLRARSVASPADAAAAPPHRPSQ